MAGKEAGKEVGKEVRKEVGKEVKYWWKKCQYSPIEIFLWTLSVHCGMTMF